MNFDRKIALIAIVLAPHMANAQVTESRKLAPPDLAAFDRFGSSVDASDGVAAIGSRLDDDTGLNYGAVYLFDRDSGMMIRKVVPPDAATGGGFGESVAIEWLQATGYLLAGKPRDRDLGIDAGAVYIFHAGTGAFVTKLHAPGGDGGDAFGASVAIDGHIAVVGAPESDANGPRAGRVFVYDLVAGTFLHTLEPAVPQNEALFGWSVAASDGLIVVGARRETGAAVTSGVAYVFSSTTGQQLARFTPPDNAGSDQFGYAVALTGRTAVIGAVGDGDNGGGSGSAYVYDLSDPLTPAMLQKLLAFDGVGGDEFGHAVDITPFGVGHRVAVGAWRADGDAGTAYMFELDAGGTPLGEFALKASDEGANANFGTTIAIDTDGAVIVGADEDSTLFSGAGAAYVYDEPLAPCPADLTGDGMLNFFDVTAYIASYNAQESRADLAPPIGVFNFFDITAFISLYNAGCP